MREPGYRVRPGLRQAQLQDFFYLPPWPRNLAHLLHIL